jgi:hypothetical protein
MVIMIPALNLKTLIPIKTTVPLIFLQQLLKQVLTGLVRYFFDSSKPEQHGQCMKMVQPNLTFKWH